MFVIEQEIFEKTYKNFEQIAKKQTESKNYTGDLKKMIDMNFELKELEIIGKGTFGRVIKSFDKKSWKFYAMKIQVIDRDYLSELMDEVTVQ